MYRSANRKLFVGAAMILGALTVGTGMLVLCAGCAFPANPRTEISCGWTGWKFHNSKDVTIELEGAHGSLDTKSIDIERLVITDNASAVRQANVEQMLAYTEQVRAVTAMFESMAASISAIIPSSVHRAQEYGLPPGWQPATPTTQPAQPE